MSFEHTITLYKLILYINKRNYHFRFYNTKLYHNLLIIFNNLSIWTKANKWVTILLGALLLTMGMELLLFMLINIKSKFLSIVSPSRKSNTKIFFCSLRLISQITHSQSTLTIFRPSSLRTMPTLSYKMLSSPVWPLRTKSK